MTSDVWAFCRDRLTTFGMARLADDYEHRAEVMPDRPGGPGAMSRQDYAAGWIAHAQRCGAAVYLRDAS